MSNTVKKAPEQEFKEGSLKPKNIDKLGQDKRVWSDKVMFVLGLKSTSSQARVLSGAIASAAQIEKNGTATDQQTARGLRATVISAGKPPWKDARKAMAASDAKVHLDLLSLPANDRQLKPLDPTKQGVNQSFWVDRKGKDDKGKGDKGTDDKGTDDKGTDDKEHHSFLCKPASNRGLSHDEVAPSGGKKGGEVAREALAGRAAQLLAGQTGIDIGMPETHVISLDSSFVPGDTSGLPVTCSVQEARPVTGDLRGASGLKKASFRPEQVAGLAIFDTLTLNTDRHAGNVMTDADGNLVPIDHGESFAEPNQDGVNRLKSTLGGPHNALLSLPGAHAPMSKDMLKKLKALDPEKYASGLTKDNAQIGAQHTDMKDAISPGAIDTAKRAAMFVKMAAKHEPPLSPASIQVAMGNSAEKLFGDAISDKQFRANAAAVIDRIAPQQGAVKEVCTSANAEYSTLVQQCEAPPLNWGGFIAKREGEPNKDAIADPVALLTIIKRQIVCPKRIDDMEAKIRELQGLPDDPQNTTVAPLSPDEALATVLSIREETFRKLMALMDRAGAAELRQRLQIVDSRPKEDRLHELSIIMSLATSLATKNQAARLTTLMATNRMTDLAARNLIPGDKIRAYLDAQAGLGVDNPIALAAAIDDVEQLVNKGDYLPMASKKVSRDLHMFSEDMAVPASDNDLKQGLAAAKLLDPFTAQDKLERLEARAKQGEFVDAPLDLITDELDALDASYTISPTDKFMSAARAAIQQRDVTAAVKAVRELRNVQMNYPPNDAGMRKLAAIMNVPDTDPDFVETLQAIAKTDQQGALQGLRKLQKRQTAGAFGTDAVDAAHSKLDFLNDNYVIDPENTILLEAQSFLTPVANDAVRALMLIARLESLAKGGHFTAKTG